MKAEDLLEKLAEGIDKPWINKNKLKFLRYGFQGDFNTIRKIREIAFKDNDLNKNEIEAFIGICDNRIDRLKSFSSDIITVVGLLIVFFGGIASILVTSDVIERGTFPLVKTLTELIKWELVRLLTIFFLIFLLFPSSIFLRYRAQIYAWYAVKEGVLLMKKNKKD